MARGGQRPGSGRKKGATAKRSKEIVDREMDRGITPIEYLLRVMRDEHADKKDRLDAAKSAAPYMHPRLAAVEVTGKDGGAMEVKSDMDPLEIGRRIAFLLAQGVQAVKAGK